MAKIKISLRVFCYGEYSEQSGGVTGCHFRLTTTMDSNTGDTAPDRAYHLFKNKGDGTLPPVIVETVTRGPGNVISAITLWDWVYNAVKNDPRPIEDVMEEAKRVLTAPSDNPDDQVFTVTQ